MAWPNAHQPPIFDKIYSLGESDPVAYRGVRRHDPVLRRSSTIGRRSAKRAHDW
jgi:hypothetical protein